MAWFRKERKSRIPARERLEIPADTWDKCEQCGHTDIRENFDRALQVCPECGHHRRVTARRYIELLTDPGSFEELYGDLRSADALEFEGYPDRLERAHRKTGIHEAMIAGHATIEAAPLSLGVMEFGFMGGSMGSVVGEKVARLTSALMAQLRSMGIPYLSILTNPTTGGVSASYAMQGDVNIAEPGAVIGFAGPRVIKQTIGQDLPDGFQTAEFLVEKGMVDAVVPRHQMRRTVSQLLRMMHGLDAAETAT
jgi:acetyl-CoA carboxylase carboxyl transferase subunit beta